MAAKKSKMSEKELRAAKGCTEAARALLEGPTVTQKHQELCALLLYVAERIESNS